MSSVKDQGKCGSCWAHAIIGMLESAYSIALNSKGLPNLSEQFLVSCDPLNKGCDGGNTMYALWYLRNT